jgi:hypothetical protein
VTHQRHDRDCPGRQRQPFGKPQCDRDDDGRQPKTSTEDHYYISTFNRRHKAETFLKTSRGHWSVENNLHWQLDVSFHEDQRRLHKGHGAENFSRLCRIALNPTDLRLSFSNSGIIPANVIKSVVHSHSWHPTFPSGLISSLTNRSFPRSNRAQAGSGPSVLCSRCRLGS